MRTPDEYQCQACGEVFTKGWTDEEALAEKEANGFGDLKPEELAMVCDVCYRKMMGLKPLEEPDG